MTNEIKVKDGIKTVTMYRPVGKNELKLIEDSGFTAYPPRLPDQPIFTLS